MQSDLYTSIDEHKDRNDNTLSLNKTTFTVAAEI